MNQVEDFDPLETGEHVVTLVPAGEVGLVWGYKVSEDVDLRPDHDDYQEVVEKANERFDLDEVPGGESVATLWLNDDGEVLHVRWKDPEDVPTRSKI